MEARAANSVVWWTVTLSTVTILLAGVVVPLPVLVLPVLELPGPDCADPVVVADEEDVLEDEACEVAGALVYAEADALVVALVVAEVVAEVAADPVLLGPG